jgi:pyruvate/2-oxoglutarate dehydrogenase complex dihydrolipoamide dehydrogenase (E3) component
VINASHILFAVGRRPNTDDLDLTAAGIAHDRGWISVNDRLETNVPGVTGWATSPAARRLRISATTISRSSFTTCSTNGSLDGRPHRSYALFTDPELGRVGLTETEARTAGRQVRVGSIPLSRVARAIERNETAGLMKVVIDAETDRILGAAVLAPGGGELVQTLMALMIADASWRLFYRPCTSTLDDGGFFALMDSVK